MNDIKNEINDTVTKEIKHRRKVSKLIYSIWTENNDISAIAPPWIDGRMDALGLYVTLSDFELHKNESEIPVEDGITLEYEDFVNEYMVLNRPVLIRNVCDDWNVFQDWITDDKLDIDYISDMYGDDTVPVHIQSSPGLTIQKSKKIEMTVTQYLQWYKQHNKEELYYLKDYKFQFLHP